MGPLQELILAPRHFDEGHSLLQDGDLAALPPVRGIQLRHQEFKVANQIVQFLSTLLGDNVMLNLLTFGLAHLSPQPRTEPEKHMSFCLFHLAQCP